MKKNTSLYVQQSIYDFFEGLLNLLLFFPYFFSISALLKTFFSPWKNIIAKKTSRGFSFSEWASRLFFNIISRAIGMVMRSTIILFYLILQIVYVLVLPFIALIFFILLPLKLMLYSFEKTEEEKKELLKEQFLATHILDKKNVETGNAWFELYYRHHIRKVEWWKLPNLLSTPPLARDWAVGYTPILDEYSEELTSPLYQARIQNIVGRTKEIQLLEEVLIKSHEPHVLIVGEEGVGKHTIVDALAKRIYEGQINTLLAYKRILKLNLEKILTTFTDLKQRENFLEDLFKEAVDAKNLILLIDNFDKYVASGVDRIDLSISIEKYAKSGGLQFIGITSPFFYERFILTNEKMNRLFNKIDVSEISPDDAIKTLLEMTYSIEQRNNVIIPYETIINTIDKSEFYITYIPFPEKAFNLLDSACAAFHQKQAGVLRKNAVILPDLIDSVLSEKTHIPTHITGVMREKLLHLEQLLSTHVLFQEDAMERLAAALRRSSILLGKRKKPLATFLFLGPTGVGKTETAKALAEIFFSDTSHLLRFDMSLYQSKDDIRTLVGSIESGTVGLLTKSIHEHPYAVLLLDEIEKADKDLLNIFLTVLDEGYFTDGFGKKVDCKNIIVIATSNAGADYIYRQQSLIQKLDNAIGNVTGGEDPGIPAARREEELPSDRVLTGNDLSQAPSQQQNPPQQNDLIAYLVEHHLFSPEFLNRFDGVVTYNPVSEQTIMALARKMTTSITENIRKMYGVNVTIRESTLDALAKKGYNPAFGARNLERTIARELEDTIAKRIIENTIKEGDAIVL
ncbi:hypothetical protein COY90_00510 [Candidatus Roizmanbacteria bacterium CG_4_10_14_0_8_um_filter_39_9]|uniref:Uncharacterized protein n=1 Tax=Candidatus Roizmanbacteria bacterium CG_4_10_14_0_8_um_filter_39_9 TaxID=1974829 RepID=A0A2M7QE06_9BACT|nr:MAG: hypothetical protein COY90_00510 [Candidatus Roizmanbacteria bacterium CG_4_10_14_0_8_um_filter_39_9]